MERINGAGSIDAGRYTIKTRKNRFTLVVILVSATLTVMSGSTIAPVLNMIRDGLGVGASSAGIIITTHSLFLAVSSPFVGIILDRIGTRKPFLFGLVLYGLGGSSGLYITSFWGLLASRAVIGIATAFIFTSITVMILNLYEGGERDQVMGWRASSNSMGGVVWPMVGGALGGISWHAPFGIYLLSIPLALATLFVIPETKKQAGGQAGGSSVLDIFRTRPVLFAIYGLVFLGSILLYAIIVYLPQQLEIIGISRPFHISLFISIMSLAGGITSLMFKKIKARLSYKSMILIILFLWTAGFTTISQTLSFVIIGAAVILVGISQGVIMPLSSVWVGELVPVSFRGRIAAYLATFGLLGQFMSPIIFAPVVKHAGLPSVFLAAAGLAVVVFLAFLLKMKR